MLKRKEPESPKSRVVLTLERRLDVLKDIDAKLTVRDIAAKYGISVGTVTNIKKTREEIQEEAARSINLPLCYQLRSNFEAECAAKKRVAQSRMLQPTLDSFFSRLSKE